MATGSLAEGARRAATRWIRMPRSRGEIRRMQRSGRSRLAAVGDGVEAALDGRLERAERVWIARIEALRGELNESRRAIRYPVFDELHPEGTLVPRTLGDACRTGSKAPRWAALLFHLVRRLQPDSALELGTCAGISGAYQAAALALNGSGCLVSLEGCEDLAAAAGEHWQRLGLNGIVSCVPGRFADTLAGVLDAHGPFDSVFVDGHHDEQATWDYYSQIQPHLVEGALLVFDDIAWSPGMRRVWRRIGQDRFVRAAIDLHKIGLVLFGRNRREPPLRFRLTL